jgi:hypothetical protein
MIGEATASLALHFGASDVNGTLEDEKIAHMAQAASPSKRAPYRAQSPNSQRGNHSAISGNSITSTNAMTWITMKSAMPR